MDGGAWKAAVHGVAKSWIRLSDFTFTFHFHALEREMATHSSVLAWRIPGTGEPGGLPSVGSQRVGHDWSDLAAGWAYFSLNSKGISYSCDLVFLRCDLFRGFNGKLNVFTDCPKWLDSDSNLTSIWQITAEISVHLSPSPSLSAAFFLSGILSILPTFVIQGSTKDSWEVYT